MNRLLLLHLSLIDGFGPLAVCKILHANFDGDIYACSIHELMQQFGLTPKTAKLLFNGLQRVDMLKREIDLIAKHNIKWTTIIDDDYPAMLKQINGPPTVLYYRGAELGQFEKNFAIVGSREAHHYAEQVVAECVPELLNFGWNIISGGALGADTMAHKHTMQNGGKTVAILGSGLLCPYPRQNIRLFDEIVQNGGSVVSPFAITAEAQARHFPARNRIISGMSQACLVVQAAKRSGASITAEYALQQGRSVFAVPGSIFDPLSAGCHRLIKEGATPMLSVDDLLIELGEKKPPIKAKVTRKSASKQPYVQTSLTLSPSATIAEKILFHCAQKPLSTDELMDIAKIELEMLHNHLFDLQLAGKLAQSAVGLWELA